MRRKGFEIMCILVSYHEDFSLYGHPMLKHRIKPSFQVLQDLISQGLIKIIEPKITPNILSIINKIHSRQHIQSVEATNYYEVSLLSVASVVQSAELLAQGVYKYGFAYVGTAGHHASRQDFWGFCYFNDVAAAILRLRELGLKKFLILDMDPHFGDGTRDFFKKDPEVVHINYDTQTKDRLDETFNNYDYGLGYKAIDEDFYQGLEKALARKYGFDFMFVIFGHDSHALDYGGFDFSFAAYPVLAEKVKEYAADKPLLWVLSGGSKIPVAVRVIPDILKTLIRT